MSEVEYDYTAFRIADIGTLGWAKTRLNWYGYLKGEELAFVLERHIGVTLPGYLRMYELKFLRGEIKAPPGRRRQDDPEWNTWEVAGWRYDILLEEEDARESAEKAAAKLAVASTKRRPARTERNHTARETPSRVAARRTMAEMRTAGRLTRRMSVETFLNRVSEAKNAWKKRPPSLVTRLTEERDALMQSRQAKAA